MNQAKHFGPFIVERMIGRGGMGAVYRARHEETGQTVAVKALLIPLEQERERFEAEISTLKLLRHENIVKLYGFGQEDGVLYYAMEYVDGPSLSALLKKNRHFTWEEVVFVGESVCRALKHAHDRGVVHRDVKPANILLASNGVIKVSDYGIAQYFGNSRLTNANQVVGTIEFMAPEQARAGAVTPKTDLYSLGALMYALLSGKPPYVARSLPELLKQYRETRPASLRSVRPELPKVVDNLILELLQIQPDDRKGDARVIGRRLEALLEASPNNVGANPFLSKRAMLIDPNEQDDSPSLLASSRVDLENPSDTTMLKDAGRDAESEDGRSPDFPYRPITDELGETFDFQSPFEKSTERSYDPERTIAAPQAARPEELNDDFEINADPSSSFAPTRVANEETSTGERPVEEKSDRESRFDLATSVGGSSQITFETSLGERETPSGMGVARLGNGAPDGGAKNESTTAVDAPSPSGGASPSSRSSNNRATAPVAAAIPIGKNIPYDALDDAADALEATPLERFKKSQFTVVEEDELGDLPPREEENREPRALFVVARAVGLAVFLVAALFVAWRAVRPPSADALYAAIEKKLYTASARNIDVKLRSVRKEATQFLETYPNDTRARKIAFYRDELDIYEIDQQLERLALSDENAYLLVDADKDKFKDPKKKERDKPSVKKIDKESALEQIKANESISRFYLDARRSCRISLEKGEKQLRAFIELNQQKEDFVSSNESRVLWNDWNESDPRVRGGVKTYNEKLLIVAKRRLSDVRKNLENIEKKDREYLTDRLNVAEAMSKINPQRAAKMRAAALELFEDREWAKETLDALRRGGIADGSTDVVEPQTDGEDSVESHGAND